MRFLILTQYFPPEVGAAQIRLLALARELQAQGHHVDVVTAIPNYPRGQIFPEYRGKWFVEETVDGIPVLRTWIYAATGTNVMRRLWNYWSFALTSLLGWWRVPRPDYVFVESPPLFLGATGYVISRLRGCRFIFNISDLWPASARELGVIRNELLLGLATRLEHFLYRSAFRVTAVTEGICDQIRGIVGDGRVMLLPNGVDTAVFRRVSPAPLADIAAGKIPFVYAGTHGYAQGLDVIVEAARLVSDRSDIVLVMVGDGPEKPRLQQLVKRQGLANIRFMDLQPVDRMAAIFSASRASIVPLRRAALFRSARPSKILPSLACETPVIYCGEGETAELLTKYHCGLAVAPESPGELANALRRLADSPSLAAELGRNGRALAETEFSWPAVVGRWLAELTSGER